MSSRASNSEEGFFGKTWIVCAVATDSGQTYACYAHEWSIIGSGGWREETGSTTCREAAADLVEAGAIPGDADRSFPFTARTALGRGMAAVAMWLIGLGFMWGGVVRFLAGGIAIVATGSTLVAVSLEDWETSGTRWSIGLALMLVGAVLTTVALMMLAAHAIRNRWRRP